jgi:putative acetyltransferase
MPTDNARFDIRIRHAEPEDYEAVRRVHAGPRAVWGTFQLPFPSAERWRKRLADTAEGKYFLLACVDEDVVGNLVLVIHTNSPRRRHAASIGMAVRDDWQGRGIGSALMQAAVEMADRWLNLTRLELEVYTDNEPAIALYKRFGFVIEGTHRKHAYRDGQFADSYSMARLKD